MALMKKLDKQKDKFNLPKEELEKLRKKHLDFVNSLKVTKYEKPDGTIQELVHGSSKYTMLDKVTLIKAIKEATNLAGILFTSEILGAMRAPGMCRITMPARKVGKE